MRVCVIGTSGSGKTTLARAIAQKFSIPYICNDEIILLPKWQPRPKPDITRLMNDATSGAHWAFDGNPGSSVADSRLLERATCIIWLDYPKSVVMRRVILRTIKRVSTREVLFSQNVEGFRQSFMSRDSIIYWAATSFERNQRRHAELFTRLSGRKQLIRLTSPWKTDRWLNRLTPAELS